MIVKQDLTSTRTASELERKYSFGKTFGEVMGLATDAQNAAVKAEDAANKASGAVNELDTKLNQEEIFNRLTNNGQAQGLYRDEDGNLFINASYIVAGILSSLSGKTYFDLDSGTIVSESDVGGTVKIDYGSLHVLDQGVKLFAIENYGHEAILNFISALTNESVGSLSGRPEGLVLCCYDQDENAIRNYSLQWKTVNGVKTLVGV